MCRGAAQSPLGAPVKAGDPIPRDLEDLPPTVPLQVASRILGIGRAKHAGKLLELAPGVLPGTAPPQFRWGGEGGARTHDRQIKSPLL